MANGDGTAITLLVNAAQSSSIALASAHVRDGGGRTPLMLAHILGYRAIATRIAK